MSKSFALQEQWLPICIILEIKTEKCIFKVYFIDYAITVVPFSSPFYFPQPCTPSPTSIPPFSSCSWVIHVSCSASPFPILFLTYSCLFCTYHLCFLFPVSFLPFSPFPLPTDNPPCDLHFCESLPVLVVCLVCFLVSVVNNCEFVVILLFIYFLKISFIYLKRGEGKERGREICVVAPHVSPTRGHVP